MIQVIADRDVTYVEWVEFSDGAITCKLDPIIADAKEYVSISVSPITPVKDVITEISLTISAIRGLTWVDIYLDLPYLPYARADRKFEEGNPEPLHVFLNQLQSLGFDKIYLTDIHNFTPIFYEYENLRNSINHKGQVNCYNETVRNHYDYIVAPDKGAVEKAETIALVHDTKLLRADKIRDISTGQITDIDFIDPIPENSKVIIVDDILDGGGTFIPLAKTLKDKGNKVDLYITHLIGAKGLDIFSDCIDNIYHYQIVGNFLNRLDVLKFNERNK